jgi:hypothetical protein
MAGSIGNAVGTVFSSRFLMTAGLTIAGTWAGAVVNSWMRENVVDIGVQGGDALYSAAGAIATMAFLPNRFARPLALGMVAAGGQTALRDYGVV